MAPSVHLNGTSRNELRDQVIDAWMAIEDALKKLNAAWPNGRDYYVQGPDALTTATMEWRDRAQRLASVRDELAELGRLITDKGK